MSRTSLLLAAGVLCTPLWSCGGGNANGLEGRYLADCVTTWNGNYTTYTLGIAGTPQAVVQTSEEQRDTIIEKAMEEGAVIHDAYCDVLLEQDGNEDLEMDKDTECTSITSTSSRVGTSTAMSTTRENVTVTWTRYRVKKGNQDHEVSISAEGDFSSSEFSNDQQQYAYVGTLELECDATRVSGE